MRVRVALLVVGLLSGAVACSRLQPKLQVAAIEKAIVEASSSQFPTARLGPAKCPSGRVQKAGDTFTCTLVVDGQTVHFRVRQTDGHGAVDAPVLVERFVLRREVESAVADEVRSRDLLDATVRCTAGVAVFVTTAQVVRCTATYDKGVVRHIRVTIGRDLQIAALRYDDALVSTFRIGTEIATALGAVRGRVVYVDCGDRQIVLAPKRTLTCQGTDGNGGPKFTVTVTIDNADGAYSYTPTT